MGASMTDEQILAYTLEQIADGVLLSDIAEEVGIKRTTLYMRLQASQELIDAYACAREAGHDTRAEKLSEKCRRDLPTLPSGAIDPAAVSQLKLEVETDKWLLAKVAPRYADRQQVEHSGTLTLEQMVMESMKPNEPHGG